MDIDSTELRATLKTLIIDKKNGKLDAPEKFNNQDKKWRDAIEYEKLWDCIKHPCPEVRRDVLELLVVSKKSTQRFVKVEYELVETFLTYNLGEKIEFVPLIKKAIKRTRDSLVVLQRELSSLENVKKFQAQHVCPVDAVLKSKMKEQQVAEIKDIKNSIQYYESFLLSLRDICVNNLYPTATYDRRRSSLQILCDMQDIVDESIPLEWKQSQVKSLFDCLVIDTYERNKDMVYKILRPMSPSYLRLDDKSRVSEIIQTAIGLGNSIRPIDSATASYMFKICLKSPIIFKEVISRHPEFVKFGAADNFDVHLALVNLLILQLEKPLEIARNNIVKAASKHSLYGYLFCIRSLISDRFPQNSSVNEFWRKSIADIVDMCFDLNQAVGQIVNNSSPEGHLPMDLNPHNLRSSLLEQESLESEKVTTPQMVLLCAWRTVKEVSLLFGYLTAKLPIDEINGAEGLLTEKQVIKIGEHFVTLLSETKHRGAFEQAHVGFGQLCGRLWHQPEGSTLKELPKTWLLELLLAVTGLSPRDSKLCATRRSAGVPFMVQALLTSEESSTAVIKHGGSFTFHSTMRILLGLTRLNEDDDLEDKMISLIYDGTAFAQLKGLFCVSNETEKVIGDFKERSKSYRLAEIKTHVLNILRALFRHCQLGECVKPYIAEGVITAIKSYSEKTWAERNAATLLFSAMVVRIFGVQRTKDHLNLSVHNKMTGRVFFDKYPTLLDFMYAELEEFVKPGDTLIRPGVQCVLLLLSRLYPGCHDSADSNWKVADFISMVSKCAKSQVYETRELAARALVPLLTETTGPVIFSNILKTVAKEPRNYSNVNMIHGYILQILHISKSPEFVTFQLDPWQLHDFLQDTIWILKKLGNSGRDNGVNFPLATTYLETISAIFRVHEELLDNSYVTHDLFPLMRVHLEERGNLLSIPGREIYETAAARLYTSWFNKFDNPKIPLVMKLLLTGWTNLYRHNNVDVQILAYIKSKELIADCATEFVLVNVSQITEAEKYAFEAMRCPIKDPNLEEAIFDFFSEMFVVFEEMCQLPAQEMILYNVKASQIRRIAATVVRYLVENLHNPDYYVRDCYLRLLGAVYHYSQDILDIDDKKAIYELFLKNSWMDSCDNHCRLAVSQTMFNLYQLAAKDNDCFVLNWWTTLLNLLVDDDKTVRQHAATIVCKIKTENNLICDAGVRRMFFEKFTLTVGAKRPDVALAALLSWGVATWREEDYEMDDTDVFNKCRNYDSFEQLEISNLCLSASKIIAEKYLIRSSLRPTIVEWLKKLYDCQSAFSELVEFCLILDKSIPKVGKKLDDCLDPTYSDKLQQVLAFKQFFDFMTQKSLRDKLQQKKIIKKRKHNKRR